MARRSAEALAPGEFRRAGVFDHLGGLGRFVRLVVCDGHISDMAFRALLRGRRSLCHAILNGTRHARLRGGGYGAAMLTGDIFRGTRMDSADSFSTSYNEAREKFQSAVSAARGTLESIPRPSNGPNGEELATDVAWLGPREAARVLVLISGTHGVEGYCGSGAQVDWLRRGEAETLPDDLAVLMIHAINPWGFAWTRRVNETNVDLNRNWVDFSDREALPKNEEYIELADDLCPSEWTADAKRQPRGFYNGERHMDMTLSGRR